MAERAERSQGKTETIYPAKAPRRRVKMKENEIGEVIVDAALTVRELGQG